MVLLVSERSLLPVLVEPAPMSTLLNRVQPAVEEVLQVLGSMTAFAFMAGDSSAASHPVDVSLKLADAPCSPLGMKRPAEVARELLVARE